MPAKKQSRTPPVARVQIRFAASQEVRLRLGSDVSRLSVCAGRRLFPSAQQAGEPLIKVQVATLVAALFLLMLGVNLSAVAGGSLPALFGRR